MKADETRPPYSTSPVKSSDGEPAVTGGRRSFLRTGLLAAGAAGLGGLMLPALHASAANEDGPIAQLAATIENLLVFVYTQALAVPLTTVGFDNPLVQSYLKGALAHHTAHAVAFNDAAVKLGTTAATGVETELQSTTVAPALPLKSAAGVVALLLALEDVATQSYIQFAGDIATSSVLLTPLRTIAPVEAGHVALLYSVQSLFGADGASPLLQLPAPLAQVSAGGGDAGFPNAFYPVALSVIAPQGSAA